MRGDEHPALITCEAGLMSAKANLLTTEICLSVFDTAMSVDRVARTEDCCSGKRAMSPML